MNEKVRITSAIVKVRSHFLVQLGDRQWEIAQHAVAAGETRRNDRIRMHLTAAAGTLDQIALNAALLGFDRLAEHARTVQHLIELFFEKGLGTVNSAKMLTDVILEIGTFVNACTRLTEQPTVLQPIDIPSFSEIIDQA